MGHYGFTFSTPCVAMPVRHTVPRWPVWADPYYVAHKRGRTRPTLISREGTHPLPVLGDAVCNTPCVRTWPTLARLASRSHPGRSRLVGRARPPAVRGRPPVGPATPLRAVRRLAVSSARWIATASWVGECCECCECSGCDWVGCASSSSSLPFVLPLASCWHPGNWPIVERAESVESRLTNWSDSSGQCGRRRRAARGTEATRAQAGRPALDNRPSSAHSFSPSLRRLWRAARGPSRWSNGRDSPSVALQPRSKEDSSCCGHPRSSPA